MSNNGFQDFQKIIKNINVEKSQVLVAQKEAANFYMQKLRPNIPKSVMAKHHMAGDLSVKVDGDEVKVMIGDWYWRFPENGTVHQRAQHFARNTLQSNEKQIEDIMVKKILNEMGL